MLPGRDAMSTASGDGAVSSGMTSLLGLLRPVLGTALGAAIDTGGVEGAAEDVITHARQVANTAAANEHDRVLLQVVPFTGNVSIYHFVVCKTKLNNFS